MKYRHCMRYLWKSFGFIGFILLLTGCALFQKNEPAPDSGIIYGPGFALSLTAPEGWELREQEAQKRSLFAVILPKGKSWDKANRRMYASIAGIDTAADEGHHDIYDLMRRDSVYFSNIAENVKITTIDTIIRSNEREVFLRKVTGIPKEPYKITAYANEETMVVMVGFGAQTEKLFNQTLPQFYRVLSSYRFFDRSAKVITPDELNE